MRWQWCVIVAAIVGACDSGAPPPDKELARAESARQQAELEVQTIIKAMADANANVEAAVRDLTALDGKITKAVDEVVSAQTDADRMRAMAELQQLRKAKVDLEARLAAAKAAAARAERAKGVHISQDCLDNPLAKGCS